MIANDDQAALLRQAAEASHKNATELLSNAEVVRTSGGTPRVAFHLATLALEEIGKSSLLGIWATSLELGQEAEPWIQKSCDDHIKKLFWAIWSPSFATGRVSSEQLIATQGMASQIHETRLRALYVDVGDEGIALPENAVEDSAVDSLIELTKARIEMSGTMKAERLPADRLEMLRWFSGVTADPNNRKAVFSKSSIDKLQEFGDIASWMNWLREQVVAADREATSKKDAELNRIPAGRGKGKPKFELTVRFHTFSHSIRPKPLNSWNDGIWVTLHPVTGHKDQVLAKIQLLDSIKGTDLFPAGLEFSNLVLLAINIGSFGFFFWYLPWHLEKYHEKLIDLESNSKMEMERPVQLIPKEKDRHVLDEPMLQNAKLALALLMSLKPPENDFVRHYLLGVRLSASSDLHLDATAQSFGEFYRAFLLAIKAFDPNSADAHHQVITEHAKRFKVPDDQIAAVTTSGEEWLRDGKTSAKLSLENALIMKVLLDSYLIETFRRIAPARLNLPK